MFEKVTANKRGIRKSYSTEVKKADTDWGENFAPVMIRKVYRGTQSIGTSNWQTDYCVTNLERCCSTRIAYIQRYCCYLPDPKICTIVKKDHLIKRLLTEPFVIDFPTPKSVADKSHNGRELYQSYY